MDLSLSEREAGWQREVLDFLVAETSDRLRALLLTEYWRNHLLADRPPELVAFLAAMAAKGWFGVAVPTEYGGMGLSAMEQYLLFEACDYHGVPHPDPMTTLSVGPTIARRGTDEQRRRWLPGVVAGEIEMALGYSEDVAGTDLANLRTRAVRDGEHWVINGRKLWNTNAHHATHEWLACRTEPDAPRHRGISMIVVPVDVPGVAVRELPTWGAVRTNEITFTDVRVPLDNLIGERGQGWTYATEALNLERVGIAQIGLLRRLFDATAAELARADPALPETLRVTAAYRLAELETKVRAMRLLALRTVWSIDRGRVPDADASLVKFRATELQAELATVALEIFGERSLLAAGEPDAPTDGLAELVYRRVPFLRFGGGTNEIQRDIVAQRGYQLPRAGGRR
ncbi:MAG TPA: acyl-CoA dehydrogenase family protein [Pseudonocardia sp.]|jgi:alkylation response protein AidB-like acyl-CoA dehydrogenase|nr:acyl-CoA dehydrogenase family protein [Pseudonocardia sp.]